MAHMQLIEDDVCRCLTSRAVLNTMAHMQPIEDDVCRLAESPFFYTIATLDGGVAAAARGTAAGQTHDHGFEAAQRMLSTGMNLSQQNHQQQQQQSHQNAAQGQQLQSQHPLYGVAASLDDSPLPLVSSLDQTPTGPALSCVASSAAAESPAAGDLGPDTSSADYQGLKQVSHVIPRDDRLQIFAPLRGSDIKKVYGGRLCKGRWNGQDIVAIECTEDGCYVGSTAEGMAPQILNEDGTVTQLQNDLQVATLLSSMSHPNLLKVYGVVVESPKLVIAEFHPHGSVYLLLERARRDPKKLESLTWERRLELLQGVAAGMRYLHRQGWCHGCLRSTQLFLGNDGQVKVGGIKRVQLGAHSIKPESHVTWTAPEILQSVGACPSAASDIYSFGIVMWELLTWQVPFAGESYQTIAEKVLAGERPRIPAEEELPPGTSNTGLKTYITLMEECWDHRPGKRPPSFEVIARRLVSMQRWDTALRDGARKYGTSRSFTTAARSSLRRRDAGLERDSFQGSFARPAMGGGSSAYDHEPAADPRRRFMARSESSNWAITRPREIQCSELMNQICGDIASTSGGSMFWGSLAVGQEQVLVAVKEYQADYLPFSAWVLPSSTVPGPQQTASASSAPGPTEDELSLSAVRQQSRAVLEEQLAIRSKIWHPNLVQFCGVCYEPPLMVMEFMQKGSLSQSIFAAKTQWHRQLQQLQGHAQLSLQQSELQQQQHQQPWVQQTEDPLTSRHIHDQQQQHPLFSWDEVVRALINIASAMAYLHSPVVNVVHGCLCSSNVFFSTEGSKVQVGGFCLLKKLASKDPGATLPVSCTPNLIRWTAPEVFDQMVIGKASDVFSFGAIMFELLTWETPFARLRNEQVHIQVMLGARPDVPPDDRLPPSVTCSPDTLQRYKDLMFRCFSQDPQQRPTFDIVLQHLQQLLLRDSSLPQQPQQLEYQAWLGTWQQQRMGLPTVPSSRLGSAAISLSMLPSSSRPSSSLPSSTAAASIPQTQQLSTLAPARTVLQPVGSTASSNGSKRPTASDHLHKRAQSASGLACDDQAPWLVGPYPRSSSLGHFRFVANSQLKQLSSRVRVRMQWLTGLGGGSHRRWNSTWESNVQGPFVDIRPPLIRLRSKLSSLVRLLPDFPLELQIKAEKDMNSISAALEPWILHFQHQQQKLKQEDSMGSTASGGAVPAIESERTAVKLVWELAFQVKQLVTDLTAYKERALLQPKQRHSCQQQPGATVNGSLLLPMPSGTDKLRIKVHHRKIQQCSESLWLQLQKLPEPLCAAAALQAPVAAADGPAAAIAAIEQQVAGSHELLAAAAPAKPPAAANQSGLADVEPGSPFATAATSKAAVAGAEVELEPQAVSLDTLVPTADADQAGFPNVDITPAAVGEPLLMDAGTLQTAAAAAANAAVAMTVSAGARERNQLLIDHLRVQLQLQDMFGVNLPAAAAGTFAASGTAVYPDIVAATAAAHGGMPEPPMLQQSQMQPAASIAAAFSLHWQQHIQPNMLVSTYTDPAVSGAGYATWPAQYKGSVVAVRTLPRHWYAIPRQQYLSEAMPAYMQRDSELIPQQEFVVIADHAVLGYNTPLAAVPSSHWWASWQHLLQHAQYSPGQQQQQQQVTGADKPHGPFVRVIGALASPPMLLEDPQSGITAASWIRQQQQQSGSPDCPGLPFDSCEWVYVLQWLLDIVKALSLMHSQQPPVVHGEVHGGTVNLAPGPKPAADQTQGSELQQAGLAAGAAAAAKVAPAMLRAQLSLVGPWHRAFTPARVVNIAVAAPEQLYTGSPPQDPAAVSNGSTPVAEPGPISSSEITPATDVYGLGVLMWQFATGWTPKPQQQGRSQSIDEIDLVYEELDWCAQMLQKHHTTFPGAAGGDIEHRHGSFTPELEQWVPSGYKELMMECSSTRPQERPSLLSVAAQLQCMLASMQEICSPTAAESSSIHSPLSRQHLTLTPWTADLAGQKPAAPVAQQLVAYDAIVLNQQQQQQRKPPVHPEIQYLTQYDEQQQQWVVAKSTWSSRDVLLLGVPAAAAAAAATPSLAPVLELEVEDSPLQQASLPHPRWGFKGDSMISRTSTEPFIAAAVAGAQHDDDCSSTEGESDSGYVSQSEGEGGPGTRSITEQRRGRLSDTSSVRSEHLATAGPSEAVRYVIDPAKAWGLIQGPAQPPPGGYQAGGQAAKLVSFPLQQFEQPTAASPQAGASLKHPGIGQASSSSSNSGGSCGQLLATVKQWQVQSGGWPATWSGQPISLWQVSPVFNLQAHLEGDSGSTNVAAQQQQSPGQQCQIAPVQDATKECAPGWPAMPTLAKGCVAGWLTDLGVDLGDSSMLVLDSGHPLHCTWRSSEDPCLLVAVERLVRLSLHPNHLRVLGVTSSQHLLVTEADPGVRLSSILAQAASTAGSPNITSDLSEPPPAARSQTAACAVSTSDPHSADQPQLWSWWLRLQFLMGLLLGLQHFHDTMSEPFGTLAPDVVMYVKGEQACTAKLVVHQSVASTARVLDVTNGDPAYCAPEVLAAGIIRYAADVYSFGSIMYSVLTGLSPPYSSSSSTLLDALLSSDVQPEVDFGSEVEQALLISYLRLMALCHINDVTLRPSLRQVLADLRCMSMQAATLQQQQQTGFGSSMAKAVAATASSSTQGGLDRSMRLQAVIAAAKQQVAAEVGPKLAMKQSTAAAGSAATEPAAGVRALRKHGSIASDQSVELSPFGATAASLATVSIDGQLRKQGRKLGSPAADLARPAAAAADQHAHPGLPMSPELLAALPGLGPASCIEIIHMEEVVVKAVLDDQEAVDWGMPSDVVPRRRAFQADYIQNPCVLLELPPGLLQQRKQKVVNIVRQLKSFNNHPTLALVHGICLNNMLVVEDEISTQPSKKSLRDQLAAQKQTGPDAVDKLLATWRGRLHMLQVTADALRYLHSRGVCHPQLTSGSIMLTADGQVRLAGYYGRLLSWQPQQQPLIEVDCMSLVTSSSSIAGRAEDLRAFGIILWEALMDQPQEQQEQQQAAAASSSSTSSQQLSDKLMASTQNLKRRHAAEPGLGRYIDLMERCLTSTEDEFSFKDVREELAAVSASIEFAQRRKAAALGSFKKRAEQLSLVQELPESQSSDQP